MQRQQSTCTRWGYIDSPLTKFADDSSLIGVLRVDETEYFSEISSFVDWCDMNYLKVNVSKTKELIFDFRIKKPDMTPLMVKNELVEIQDTYKYLGLTIDNKFSWYAHVETLVKRLNQRLYFLRKLRSLYVNRPILQIFYNSTMVSIITFGISCYGSNLGVGLKNKIDRIIKHASRVIGIAPVYFDTLYINHVMKKADSIRSDNSHPLRCEYVTSNRPSTSQRRL